MLFWCTVVVGVALLLWYMREDRRIDKRLFWAVGPGPWAARVASAFSGVLLVFGTLLGILTYLLCAQFEKTVQWCGVVTLAYAMTIAAAAVMLVYACLYSRSKQR
mgnify:CR=1 FL=1